MRLSGSFGSEDRMDPRFFELRLHREPTVAAKISGKIFFYKPAGKHVSGSPALFLSAAQSMPGPGSALRPGAMCSWPATCDKG